MLELSWGWVAPKFSFVQLSVVPHQFKMFVSGMENGESHLAVASESLNAYVRPIWIVDNSEQLILN